MAKRPKIYPGDLQPIPSGIKAERIQTKRFQNLCRFFGIRVPNSIEGERTLLRCLIKRHLPDRETELANYISSAEIDDLRTSINNLIANHCPGLWRASPQGKSGRPKGAYTKPKDRDTILFSLIEQRRPVGLHHWDAINTIQHCLETNRKYSPNTQLNNPNSNSVQAAYTLYRGKRARLGRAEQKRLTKIQPFWDKFLSNCTLETKKKIDQWSDLISKHKEAQALNNHKEAERLQSEISGITLEIVESSDGIEFLNVCTDETTYEMLKGKKMLDANLKP